MKTIQGLLAAAMVMGGACLVATSVHAANGDPDDKQEVRRGEVVYRDHCASCHGTKLEGEPNWQRRGPDGRMPAPPHDSSGHTWHHGDQQLFRVIKGGMKPPVAPEGYQSNMPAFEGVIGDEDIWAAIAFIKSNWSPSIRARHKARTGSPANAPAGGGPSGSGSGDHHKH